MLGKPFSCLDGNYSDSRKRGSITGITTAAQAAGGIERGYSNHKGSLSSTGSSSGFMEGSCSSGNFESRKLN